ncbi:unnamed protein product [Cylicocyclus nassatus]|uniref:Uncharacterized protein n=1 Tax=Cylicocyclus nassatus TaxID=53992 RepID=A0AA36GZ24_CYLNA|nr:unnamed protein product [Cylicocyclus nassatus]
MADEKVLLNDDDLDQDMGAIPKDAKTNCETVTQTFAKYGVKVDDYGGIINDNKYFIGGKEVTSTQALEHVREEINKSLK